jgi:hypothetical protein
MAGAGFNDVTMATTMLDPGLEIGAHIRDQANPSKYLERQIRKAHDAIAKSPRQPPPHSGRRAEVNSNQDRLLLNMQRKELWMLYRMRGINSPFDTWTAESEIDLRHLYDPSRLGTMVELNAQEYQRFATEPMGRPEKRHRRNGRLVVSPAAQFPKRLMPAGFTVDQTIEWRKKFNRPKRAAAERSRRAEARAAEDLRLRKAAELVCKKSAILTVLSDQWITIKDVTRDLAGSLAFMTPDGKSSLTGDSLRRAVARELEKPDLKCMIEMIETIQRNGLPIKHFRRRPPVSGSDFQGTAGGGADRPTTRSSGSPIPSTSKRDWQCSTRKRIHGAESIGRSDAPQTTPTLYWVSLWCHAGCDDGCPSENQRTIGTSTILPRLSWCPGCRGKSGADTRRALPRKQPVPVWTRLISAFFGSSHVRFSENQQTRRATFDCEPRGDNIYIADFIKSLLICTNLVYWPHSVPSNDSKEATL